MASHSQEYRSPTTVVPFPKIVAICGAHTALGQHLFRDLLHSEQVDKVHAIATEDIPLLSTLPAPILRKARVTIVNADRLDNALSRIVECDLAFCVMTTDRHASSATPKPIFHAINYSAPVRFIQRMFQLGVLHLSVLSHVNADPTSRSEFYGLKAELESFLQGIRRDAADFAPVITLYRMPSNIMASPAASSSSSSRTPSRDRKGRDVDLVSVQVNHVATAMQIDAFEKAAVKGPPGSRRRSNSYEVFDVEHVHRRLTESAYGDSWRNPL